MTNDITPEVVCVSEELPMPSINLNLTAPAEKKQELAHATAENLGKFCEEVMKDIRVDAEKLDDIICNFMEAVTNGGDSTSSSKEALVNLIKTKTDLADKKIKVMDLLMRAYLKESNTFKAFLKTEQNNYLGEKKTSLIKQAKEKKD